VANPFLHAWAVSSCMAYPSSSPNVTGSSSVWWCQPVLGQGLLAVVQLFAWYLQLPVPLDHTISSQCLVVITRQLQLLVEGAVAAKWDWPPATGCCSEGGRPPDLPAEGRLPDSAGHHAVEDVTSGTIRAQVGMGSCCLEAWCNIHRPCV
jgi:hypothetical protein